MSKIIVNENGNIYNADVIIREESFDGITGNGRYVAILPEFASSLNPREMTCYAEVGQHSACTWEGILHCTIAPRGIARSRVLAELEKVGYYHLNPVSEPTGDHLAERMKEINRWRSL